MPTEPCNTRPPDDDAAADAGAKRQQNQVVHAPARAHPSFAQRGGVGVIFQDHPGAQLRFDIVANGEAFEFRQVVGADDDAPFHLDETRHRHPEANQAMVGEPAPQAHNGGDHVGDNGLRAFVEVRRSADPRKLLSIFSYGCGAEIGTA